MSSPKSTLFSYTYGVRRSCRRFNSVIPFHQSRHTPRGSFSSFPPPPSVLGPLRALCEVSYPFLSARRPDARAFAKASALRHAIARHQGQFHEKELRVSKFGAGVGRNRNSRTNSRSIRRANDCNSRGHANRRFERVAAKKPTNFRARKSHRKINRSHGANSRRCNSNRSFLRHGAARTDRFAYSHFSVGRGSRQRRLRRNRVLPPSAI